LAKCAKKDMRLVFLVQHKRITKKVEKMKRIGVLTILAVVSVVFAFGALQASADQIAIVSGRVTPNVNGVGVTLYANGIPYQTRWTTDGGYYVFFANDPPGCGVFSYNTKIHIQACQSSPNQYNGYIDFDWLVNGDCPYVNMNINLSSGLCNDT
jgi:hypothetical protein